MNQGIEIDPKGNITINGNAVSYKDMKEAINSQFYLLLTNPSGEQEWWKELGNRTTKQLNLAGKYSYREAKQHVDYINMLTMVEVGKAKELEPKYLIWCNNPGSIKGWWNKIGHGITNDITEARQCSLDDALRRTEGCTDHVSVVLCPEKLT